MLADFVKESVSAGGTGNLTLGGAVSGFRTFNTAIGQDIRFPYTIRDGTAWETGVGYLSAATTFVRQDRHDSSTGSALNVTTSAEVHCGLSARATAEETGSYAGAEHHHPYMSEHTNSEMTSLDADEIRYHPFRVEFPDTYDAILVDCESTGGGADIRAGIYDCRAGQPENLLAVFDTATALTGSAINTFAFDGGSLFLPAGWYFIALHTDGNPNFEGSPTDSIPAGPLGSNFSSSVAIPYSAISVSRTFAAMPNPAALSGATLSSNAALTVALRQG